MTDIQLPEVWWSDDQEAFVRKSRHDDEYVVLAGVRDLADLPSDAVLLAPQVPLGADNLEIVNGWLVERTDEHTCGGGGPEASGMHEESCGLEPLVNLAELPGYRAPGGQDTGETRPRYTARLNDDGWWFVWDRVGTRQVGDAYEHVSVARQLNAKPRVWHEGDPEPDDVGMVIDASGYRKWCRNRADRDWYLRDIGGSSLTWQALLIRSGPLTEWLPKELSP